MLFNIQLNKRLPVIAMRCLKCRNRDGKNSPKLQQLPLFSVKITNAAKQTNQDHGLSIRRLRSAIAGDRQVAIERARKRNSIPKTKKIQKRIMLLKINSFNLNQYTFFLFLIKIARGKKTFNMYLFWDKDFFTRISQLFY